MIVGFMANYDFMGKIDLDKIKKYAISRFKLHSYIHGMHHWERVEKNGLMLAEYDPQVNKRVVVLFAYLHDCERQDDFTDDEHGIRSAEKLYDISETLLADLDDDEFELLYTAIAEHNGSTDFCEPTIDACLDADRLDLGRVGITLDPNRMCTKKGKEIAIKQLSVFI